MNYRTLKRLREGYQHKVRHIQQATLATLAKESTEAQERRILHLLQPEHYNVFFTYYFGADAGFPLAGSASAPFHAQAYQQLLQHHSCQQIRLWFRGAAKSTQTNIGNAFALKCLGETQFMLLVGINQERANLLLFELQAQLEGNERIVKDFGKQVSYGDWSRGMFETQDHCFFMAVGIDQPFRGLKRYSHRIDLAIVDDVEDRKIASNPRRVHERCEKITRDLMQAFHKDRRRLVLCNNLSTRQGIIAHLMAQMKHLKNTFLQRVNLTTPTGQSNWPQYFTQRDIQHLKATTDAITLQSEYYNNPIERGRVFKREWVRYITPTKKRLGSVGCWDLSYTKQGDYKAFALVSSYPAQYVVEALFCRQCEAAEAIRWHYDEAEARSQQGWYALYYYDATAAQESVFFPLFRAEAETRGNAQLPLAIHLGADKYLRIEATLTTALQYGVLAFHEQLKGTRNADEAIQQLLAFEKGSGAYDDFPDALEVTLRWCFQHFPARGQALKTPLIGKRRWAGY